MAVGAVIEGVRDSVKEPAKDSKLACEWEREKNEANKAKSGGIGPKKAKAEIRQGDFSNFWELSFRQKAVFVRDNITVEPMLACYIMPSVLASLATQNLNLEKACRVNLGYSDDVCTALAARETANYTHQESEVQKLVAGMAGWKTFVQSSVPAILILFLGAWTDRTGRRKPCMLMPILGEFLTSIGLIVCTYFFHELPMEAAGLVESVFPALTGGWFTMFMAVFSYIADVTEEDSRTLRIGIVNVFCSLGIPVGMALSGVLYKRIGFYGVFSLSAVMYLFSFWYGYVMIKETPRPRKELELVKMEKEAAAPDAAGTATTRCCSAPRRLLDFLRDFFDMRHIQETFRVAFKKGENMRRKRVILLMVVVMVVIGPMHGEMTVMYLFTRLRFNWNEVDFSLFSSYGMVTNLIGTIISVGLFSHILGVDDALIGIMSCMSKILSGFVYAFATTTLGIYLAPLVDMVNGTSFISMRSIASKLVPPDELGKINSLVGVCEALMPLVYGPMYSAVYQATLNTVPGAFFLLGGALTAPAVVIFGWMYTVHRKERLAGREKDAAAKDAEGCVNMGFEQDGSGGKEQQRVTTADVFLRASWREKRNSGNNNSSCLEHLSEHLAPLPASLEVPKLPK